MLHIMHQEKKACRWTDSDCNLENDNTLAIEMRKHFTETATKRCSSNLCLAAIIKVI